MDAPWKAWGPRLYDAFWSKLTFSQEQTRYLTDALRSANPVLDLGTGIGTTAAALVGEGKTVYGMDVDREMLQYVQGKIDTAGVQTVGQFVPLHADVQTLESMVEITERFDGVCCASNMAYFSDLDAVMRGVKRALRQDGRGVFAITGYEGDRMQQWLERASREARTMIENHQVALSADERKRLTATGAPDMQTIDCMSRTRAALERHGFAFLQQESFFDGTAYFMVAKLS